MSSTHSRSAPGRRGKRTSGSRGSASRRSSANAPPVEHEPIEVTPSSGNVFLDIGFSPEEAAKLLIRSDLTCQIHGEIQRRKLAPARAARLFGVDQSTIRDLMGGKIERFTLDMLIGMLGRAGLDVRVTLIPRAA